MNDLVCPGCRGPKTKRARLCAECRRRANSVGEQVWTDTRIPTVPARPRTAQQNTVYHAKCADLAKLSEQDKPIVQAAALAWASKRFQRLIESSTELTEIQMEIVLEHLDVLLAEAKAPTGQP